MRINQTMEAMREDEQAIGRTRIGRAWVFGTDVEKRDPYVSDGSRFFPAIVKSTRVECACG